MGEVFPILQLGLCSPSDVVVKSLCCGLRQTRVSATSQQCVIEQITHILQVLVSSHVSRNNNNSICFMELMYRLHDIIFNMYGKTLGHKLR